MESNIFTMFDERKVVSLVVLEDRNEAIFEFAKNDQINPVHDDQPFEVKISWDPAKLWATFGTRRPTALYGWADESRPDKTEKNAACILWWVTSGDGKVAIFTYEAKWSHHNLCLCLPLSYLQDALGQSK